MAKHRAVSLSGRNTLYGGELPSEASALSSQALVARREQAIERQQILDEAARKTPLCSIVRTQIARNVFATPGATNLEQVIWTLNVTTGQYFECRSVAYRFHDPALQSSTDLSVVMLVNGQHVAPNWFFEGDTGVAFRRLRPTFGDPSFPIPLEPVVIAGPAQVDIALRRNAVTWLEFVSLTLTVVGRLYLGA